MPRWTSKLSDEELAKRKAARDKKYQTENAEVLKEKRKKYLAGRAFELKYYRKMYYLRQKELRLKESTT